MTKTVLPPCFVQDRKRFADAVIRGTLLCGNHAVAEIEKIKQKRASERQIMGATSTGPGYTFQERE